jgi:hypothetical protein
MPTPRPALSEDELTVLSIGAEGASMMALGRWEKPVKRLATLGYFRAADQFNYFITSAGSARWAEEEAGEVQALIDWNNSLVEKRQKEADDAAGDATSLQ